MGRRIKDLTGNRYGRLVVMERAVDVHRRRPHWHCICDCGQMTTVDGSALVGGNTLSCGCLRDEKASDRLKALNARGGGRRSPRVHGTVGGYNRHRLDGEPACEDCQTAKAAYSREQMRKSRRRQRVENPPT